MAKIHPFPVLVPQLGDDKWSSAIEMFDNVCLPKQKILVCKWSRQGNSKLVTIFTLVKEEDGKYTQEVRDFDVECGYTTDWEYDATVKQHI